MEKTFAAISGLEETTLGIIEEVQKGLLDKAIKMRDERTTSLRIWRPLKRE